MIGGTAGLRHIVLPLISCGMALNHGVSDLTHRIIGAAIEVHRHLGPGLLESSYEDCLCHEPEVGQTAFLRQPFLPIVYKGRRLHGCYRPDIIVENAVIVEVKAVDKLIDVHSAQVLTYMKHAEIKVGLLVNFNSEILTKGLKRFSL